MGLQLGYLLGGSILIETVFSWPGTGFLLNTAIFQRDLPLLQGTILVLALFFVVLNLLVDIVQTGDRSAHQAELSAMSDQPISAMSDTALQAARPPRRAATGPTVGRRLARDQVSSPARFMLLADRARRDLRAVARAWPIPTGLDHPPAAPYRHARAIRSAPTSSAATCSRG